MLRIWLGENELTYRSDSQPTWTVLKYREREWVKLEFVVLARQADFWSATMERVFVVLAFCCCLSCLTPVLLAWYRLGVKYSLLVLLNSWDNTDNSDNTDLLFSLEWVNVGSTIFAKQCSWCWLRAKSGVRSFRDELTSTKVREKINVGRRLSVCLTFCFADLTRS